MLAKEMTNRVTNFTVIDCQSLRKLEKKGTSVIQFTE